METQDIIAEALAFSLGHHGKKEWGLWIVETGDPDAPGLLRVRMKFPNGPYIDVGIELDENALLNFSEAFSNLAGVGQ
ncbi:MAG: hypothetical protein ACPGO3_13240 [Magnetospiraceae bacterium]